MRVAGYSFVWFALSSFAWGQGVFTFSNLDPPSGVNAPVFDAAGARLSGANYLAMLYVGSTPDSLQPAVNVSLAPAVHPFRTDPAAGYIVPNNVSAQNVAGFTLVWVQMRAWDARLGASYDEARQLGLGGYGESDLFQTQAGGGTGAGVESRPLLGLQSFSLRAVVPSRAQSACLWWLSRCSGWPAAADGDLRRRAAMTPLRICDYGHRTR